MIFGAIFENSREFLEEYGEILRKSHGNFEK